MYNSEIIDYLENLCPLETAESFDNPGLLVGSLNRLVNKCVVCLDVTTEVVDLAIENGASLIISHHPLIFGGIKNVTDNDCYGKLIIRMIENGISLYSMHTNLDKNHDLSNVQLAKILDGRDVYSIDEVNCGVFYSVSNSPLCEYSKLVNSKLGDNGVISIGSGSNQILKVFVQGGAFDESSVPYLLKEKVDLVISGEIKHHITLMLSEYGISSIIAGHKATEDTFMRYLSEILTKRFSDIEFLLSL